MREFNQIGDKIIGDRIVAIYQDFIPKKGYNSHPDGRLKMMLKKSVRCVVEKAVIKKKPV
ncbi:MAG: hypothetical protein O8C62_03110 [Candidatus Methanoperedens sp.]|nr:hypothetical protein [Candidatus Methanoperedens sp.]